MTSRQARRGRRTASSALAAGRDQWSFGDPLSSLSGSRDSFPEDRRFYAPAFEPARLFSGAPARTIVYGKKATVFPSRFIGPSILHWPDKQIAFKTPRNVPICVKRKQRKEIMHAKGVAGGKVKKPRQTYYSQVRCR